MSNAQQAAIDKKSRVAQNDFLFAIQKINDTRTELQAAKNGSVAAEEPSEELSAQIMSALQEQENPVAV